MAKFLKIWSLCFRRMSDLLFRTKSVCASFSWRVQPISSKWCLLSFYELGNVMKNFSNCFTNAMYLFRSYPVVLSIYRMALNYRKLDGFRSKKIWPLTPSILPPRVRVPSTPSTLSSIYWIV